MEKKVYKCLKCGKMFDENKPVRLCEFKYNFGKGYRQYKYTAQKYDLCERCYKVFKRWINKQNIK